MKWTSESSDGVLRSRGFAVAVDHRHAAGTVWTRIGDRGPRPLVLVGHGGARYDESDAVQDVVRLLVLQRGLAVAAIDGPAQGVRQLNGSAAIVTAPDAFAGTPCGETLVHEMVVAWHVALDGLAGLPEVDAGAIGWFGLALGTAFGIPLSAVDRRIRAAVLGMWGAGRGHGERLLAEAGRVRCPVLFQSRREDEYFTSEDQRALFDALPGPLKELRVYEGSHLKPSGSQLHEALQFLLLHLERFQ